MGKRYNHLMTRRLASIHTPRSVLLLIILAASLMAQPLFSQNLSEQSEMRIRELERRTDELEKRTREIQKSQTGAAAGAVAYLFGAFCALWAQNTNRNAWLWFFLGLFFSVITVIFLLVKNSNDRRPPNPRLFSEGRRIGTP
jgi:sensor c-di-GMP phosphodiesterase-like protein